MCARAPERDGNQRRVTCPGRCITNEHGQIRESKKGHNHVPTLAEDFAEELSDELPEEELIIM